MHGGRVHVHAARQVSRLIILSVKFHVPFKRMYTVFYNGRSALPKCDPLLLYTIKINVE